MDKNKDEISTRLRLPVELHHKLGALADLDNNRSLHNYMIKVLQDHVIDAEKEILDKYHDDFDYLYSRMFGDKFEPYILKVDILTEILNPQIEFHVARSSIMKQVLGRGKRLKQEKIDKKKSKEFLDKAFGEIRVASNKVAEESTIYNIEFNDNDKSDNS